MPRRSPQRGLRDPVPRVVAQPSTRCGCTRTRARKVVGLPQAMAVCPRVLRATTADNRTAPRSRERRARRRPDVRSEADGQRARQHPLPNRRRRSGVAAIFTVATTAAAVHATSNVPPGRSRTLRAAIPGRDRKRSQQALDPRPRPALVSRQAPHRARYTPASSTISASAFAQTGEIVPFRPA